MKAERDLVSIFPARQPERHALEREDLLATRAGRAVSFTAVLRDLVGDGPLERTTSASIQVW